MTRTPTRLGNLLALAHYGGPPHAPRSAVEWLRTFSFTERVKNQSPARRQALRVFAAALWPYVAAQAAWRGSGRSAQGLSHRIGRFSRMLQSALLHHTPPVEYTAYNFDDPDTQSNAHHYLYWTDSSTLGMLNRLRGASGADANDKVRFAEICKAHELPHIRTLASFKPGQPTSAAERDLLNAHEHLWVKAVDLNASRGTELWTRGADSRYSNGAGLKLTLDELISHLSARICIVQPRLLNHAILEDITNGRLASLRVVTVRKRKGDAQAVAHLLTIPRGNHLTSTGGIGLHISADGAVDAIDTSAGPAEHTHPDTGVALLGHAVPFFAEAVALAERAHTQAFPLFATLGWDVALTQDGPLLIETNTGWGALSLQVLGGPLGLGPLSDVLQEERLIVETPQRG